MATIAGEHPLACAAAIAEVEAYAALVRMRRGGRLTAAGHRVGKMRLATIWREMTVIAVDEGVIALALDLVEPHALRGYDAVHLAAALAVGDAVTRFACFDGELRAAAQAEGLALLPGD
jgi:hypothetical protein